MLKALPVAVPLRQLQPLLLQQDVRALLTLLQVQVVLRPRVARRQHRPTVQNELLPAATLHQVVLLLPRQAVPFLRHPVTLHLIQPPLLQEAVAVLSMGAVALQEEVAALAAEVVADNN
jgi:hypothetical protein